MYIGSHNGNNDRYIGSGVYFKRAYSKNPDAFTRKIVIRGDMETIRKYEDIILKAVDAENNNMYYNLKNSSIGGKTSGSFKKGHTVSEETKEKIAKASLGRKHSEETKRKMSISQSYKKPWVKNKDKNKPVYSEVLNIRFESKTECAKHLGLSKSTISAMMNGRMKNRYKIIAL